MAKHLDIEEQEQLDQIKHFWAQYGNLITWVLIVVFGSVAAFNGWNYWQRTQATKAAALFEEIDNAARASDAERIERTLAEMKSGFGGTTFAAQGALLAAKTLHDTGNTDAARNALTWVADSSSDKAYQAVARLRLAALDVDSKALDRALKTLEASVPRAFEPLVADRRGDVFMEQGKPEEAKSQYLTAWRGLTDQVEYRRLVEIKLAALGVDVTAQAAVAEAAK
jgi:predicted negative regulator of RcsB-dependent stress response